MRIKFMLRLLRPYYTCMATRTKVTSTLDGTWTFSKKNELDMHAWPIYNSYNTIYSATVTIIEVIKSLVKSHSSVRQFYIFNFCSRRDCLQTVPWDRERLRQDCICNFLLMKPCMHCCDFYPVMQFFSVTKYYNHM